MESQFQSHTGLEDSSPLSGGPVISSSFSPEIPQVEEDFLAMIEDFVVPVFMIPPYITVAFRLERMHEITLKDYIRSVVNVSLRMDTLMTEETIIAALYLLNIFKEQVNENRARRGSITDERELVDAEREDGDDSSASYEWQSAVRFFVPSIMTAFSLTRRSSSDPQLIMDHKERETWSTVVAPYASGNDLERWGKEFYESIDWSRVPSNFTEWTQYFGTYLVQDFRRDSSGGEVERRSLMHEWPMRTMLAMEVVSSEGLLVSLPAVPTAQWEVTATTHQTPTAWNSELQPLPAGETQGLLLGYDPYTGARYDGYNTGDGHRAGYPSSHVSAGSMTVTWAPDEVWLYWHDPDKEGNVNPPSDDL